MNVIADFCLVPLGTGVSLSPYVAACERVLQEAGLPTVLHANGGPFESTRFQNRIRSTKA